MARHTKWRSVVQANFRFQKMPFKRMMEGLNAQKMPLFNKKQFDKRRCQFTIQKISFGTLCLICAGPREAMFCVNYKLEMNVCT